MKHNRLNVFMAGLAITFFVSSCTTQSTETIGINTQYMDTSVSPGEDFYRYVNGKWMDEVSIPDDRGRWGSFDELRKKNDAVVLEVLTKATESGQFTEGSDEVKVALFYEVGMDSVLAEERGVSPIESIYNKIDKISSMEEMQNLIEEMHVVGFDPFFGIGVFPDFMNSKMNAVYLASSGLGLPNRDYYTKTDSTSVALRAKYLMHISHMLDLSLTEYNDFIKVSKKVYAVEETLALASYTPLQDRDYSLMYNPHTVPELQKLNNTVSWEKYLSKTGANNVDTIIVMNPSYMKTVDSVFTHLPLEDLKWYIKWRTIDRAANYLNAEVVQANFDFFSKEMSGVDTMKKRWERVLSVTNGALGEALGKLYVAEVFPPEAKASAEEMVADVVTAFESRIKALDWMTDSTKIKALEKLSNFRVKIGYPDEWKNYSELLVEASGDDYSYFGNVMHASEFEHYEVMDKIGKEVDKKEWGMNPQTVNAYYHPMMNEIVFPAAILQPPFYDYRADAAVNYGGIGAVIGHEISHGFDDKGSRFDAQGNMINWWTDIDREEFEKRTEKLVAQYDAYEPLDSLHVQGELTLGENIGDLGGINVAYDALQLYLERNGRPELIDGFTPEQRLFLSWGTIWRTKTRDEALRTQVQSDVHSPGIYRAYGPLVNLETFYAAFNIKEGDEMWKPEGDRVKIW